MELGFWDPLTLPSTLVKTMQELILMWSHGMWEAKAWMEKELPDHRMGRGYTWSQRNHWVERNLLFSTGMINTGGWHIQHASLPATWLPLLTKLPLQPTVANHFQGHILDLVVTWKGATSEIWAACSLRAGTMSSFCSLFPGPPTVKAQSQCWMTVGDWLTLRNPTLPSEPSIFYFSHPWNQRISLRPQTSYKGNLWDQGLGKEFLGLTPKSHSKTGKIDNLDIIKIKNIFFCVKRMKKQTIEAGVGGISANHLSAKRNSI